MGVGFLHGAQTEVTAYEEMRDSPLPHFNMPAAHTHPHPPLGSHMLGAPFPRPYRTQPALCLALVCLHGCGSTLLRGGGEEKGAGGKSPNVNPLQLAEEKTEDVQSTSVAREGGKPLCWLLEELGEAFFGSF